MAITDIQISDELQTGAPPIKYEGNEGPQDPRQEQALALLKEEYMQYVFEQKEMDEPVMSFEEWYQSVYQASKMGVQAPREQITTEETMVREPAAFGGIMDSSTGRRAYGIGSKLKRAVRKIIPNEVARVAEVAAPFVAPFNPLIGGAMAGIGGFDRHGSLGKGLRSGLMTYGLGNVARYAGGAGPQWGLKAPGAGTGFGSYFTTPVGAETGIGKMLSDRKAPTNIDAMSGGEYGEIYKEPVFGAGDALGGEMQTVGVEAAKEKAKENYVKQTLGKIKKFGLDNKAIMGIVGVSSLAGLMSAMEQPETMESPDRGVGLPGGISGIRTEVIEAMKDPSGEKLKALRVKYPFLGAQETKNIDLMAQGGRIGKAEGGIMDLGGMEKDYRNTGGFVDLGAKEKADDVPARLSVNEFVMTADAVRGAGGGDIDKGAEIMERVMKNLEEGGRISEESQGLTNRRQGASDMFEVSERLSAVV